MCVTKQDMVIEYGGRKSVVIALATCNVNENNAPLKHLSSWIL